jgi:hypothetical protein
MDILARNTTRKIFRLPLGSIVNIFHTRVCDGGFGLPILSQSIAIQRLKFWCTCLCRESDIKDLFINSLLAEAIYSDIYIDPRYLKPIIGHKFGLNYNKNVRNDHVFFFMKTNVSTSGNIAFARNTNAKDSGILTKSYWKCNLALFYKLNIAFVADHVNSILDVRTAKDVIETGLALKHTESIGDTIWLSTHQSKEQLDILKRTLFKMKSFFKDQAFDELRNGNKQFQVHVFGNLSQNVRVRRFQLKPIADLIQHYSQYHSDKFIQFVMKARLNLHGNAVYKHIYNIRDCDKCPRAGCNQQEWTKHIVSSCNSALNQYKKRHDVVLKKLEEEIKEYCSELIIDTATLPESRERPDISLARLKTTNKIQIGEVTIPFDNLIDVKRQFKIDKYKNWIERFKEQHPETQPTLATIVIGALGTLDAEILNNLCLLGIPKDRTKKFAVYLANQVLYKTHSIWISRCNAKWRRRAPHWIRNN